MNCSLFIDGPWVSRRAAGKRVTGAASHGARPSSQRLHMAAQCYVSSHNSTRRCTGAPGQRVLPLWRLKCACSTPLQLTRYVAIYTQSATSRSALTLFVYVISTKVKEMPGAGAP